MTAENSTPSAEAGAAVMVTPGQTNPVFVAMQAQFPGAHLVAGSMLGQDWAVVGAADLVEVLRFLRDDPRTDFKMLLDVTAVDLIPRSPRWEVVYSLLSLSRNKRYRLKVEVPDGAAPVVPSATPVWAAANFYEREIFDLMGISFSGHPNLRRIMLPEDWIGHPLRHDHPLGGEQVSFTS